MCSQDSPQLRRAPRHVNNFNGEPLRRELIVSKRLRLLVLATCFLSNLFQRSHVRDCHAVFAGITPCPANVKHLSKDKLGTDLYHCLISINLRLDFVKCVTPYLHIYIFVHVHINMYFNEMLLLKCM